MLRDRKYRVVSRIPCRSHRLWSPTSTIVSPFLAKPEMVTRRFQEQETGDTPSLRQPTLAIHRELSGLPSPSSFVSACHSIANSEEAMEDSKIRISIQRRLSNWSPDTAFSRLPGCARTVHGSSAFLVSSLLTRHMRVSGPDGHPRAGSSFAKRSRGLGQLTGFPGEAATRSP
jgi:hypothetical protein